MSKEACVAKMGRSETRREFRAGPGDADSLGDFGCGVVDRRNYGVGSMPAKSGCWGVRMRAVLCVSIGLLVCSRSLLAGEDYPEFSWDRVPLYAHLAVGDGLKAEQIEFLADHFNVVTFTGGTVTNGSVEHNIAASAKAIKQRNPGEGHLLLGVRHAEATVERLERDVSAGRLSQGEEAGT